MIINVGAVLGLSSTMVVMVLGQPRVFYSMGKDGLLPAWAAKVHPKYRTPHITTIITGTIVAIMAGTVNVSILGELVSIGTLFAFVIVSTGVIVLRHTNPNLKRPFKVPFSPVIPIAAAAASAYLMNGLPLDTWLRLIVWMSIGLVIYFAYSYMHSNLAGGISDTAENYGSADANPVTGKAPIAPMIAILSAVVLTIYMFAFTDKPAFERLVDTSIRLFVWVSMGVLVYYLMYQNRSREAMAQPRNPQTARIGLMLSGINLLVWLGVGYWYLRHFAELHNK
jgi:amino acid transporter